MFDPSNLRSLVISLLLSTASGFVRPLSTRPVAVSRFWSSSSSSSPFSDEFLTSFCGDFDNYNQVVRDRQEGMLPREGGGHEHIHCTLVPFSRMSRLAAFYFDGNPKKIFRFRYYEIKDDGNMELYTLDPELEGKMRMEADPMKWPQIFSNHDGTKIHELPKCDVQWNEDPDPVQHEYAVQAYPNRPGDHAVMVYGEAVVDSTMMPGTKILVRDQLSLWDDEFWIHDRGFDPKSMNYIYGNQRGVPYQLERVTNMHNGERSAVNQELRWTLGSEWRTEEEYAANMNAIDGVSSNLNS